MATDAQLIQALENAATKLVGRELTTQEKARLVELFNKSAAKSTFQRAQESIINFSSIDESVLIKRAAASDDTNRAIRDLKDIADNWKK
ncbi:MAG: hypothetical protein IPK22_05280 [Verrucomicrobiaceae bacterium]|nr:hypothetical protein [Verrucomicrobiaceae bacterium]